MSLIHFHLPLISSHASQISRELSIFFRCTCAHFNYKILIQSRLCPVLWSESVMPSAWGGVPASAQLMVSRLHCALRHLAWTFESGPYMSTSLAGIRRWLPPWFNVFLFWHLCFVVAFRSVVPSNQMPSVYQQRVIPPFVASLIPSKVLDSSWWSSDVMWNVLPLA